MYYCMIQKKDSWCIGYSYFDEIPPDTETMKYMAVEGEDGDFLYHKYVDGKWSEEKFLPPEPDQIKTETEKLSESVLVLSEAFATKYEEDINKDLKNSEVLATIYEALLEGGK